MGQVIDRGMQIGQQDPSVPAPTTPPTTPPTTTPTTPPTTPGDPFAAWYKNTIQANPDKYDTNISQDQWKAWFPLWNGTGFKSSKVDQNGSPISGSFDNPDQCPDGMAAFGSNQCRPVGTAGSGFNPGASGFNPSGSGFGNYSFGNGSGFNFQGDPGYQFRLKQGEQALEQSAAARGMLNTGQTLEDVLKYGQNYASNEYSNAYQRAWNQYTFGIDDEFRREQMLYNGGPPTGA